MKENIFTQSKKWIPWASIILVLVLVFVVVNIRSYINVDENNSSENHSSDNNVISVDDPYEEEVGHVHEYNISSIKGIGGGYDYGGYCRCVVNEVGYKLSKPNNTNLDFWVYDVTSNSAFNLQANLKTNFYSIYDDGSAGEYFNKKYTPITNADGKIEAPEQCVTYYIRIDETFAHHVYTITITDPEVYFDGISLNSSIKEFKEYAERNGLKIRYENDSRCIAQTGHYRIEFEEESIIISYERRYYAEGMIIDS